MSLNRKLLVGAGICTVGLAVAATSFAVTHSGKPDRFAAFDLNDDGAVGLTEIREIGQRRFEVLDVDGSGAISGAELPLMLQASGPLRDGARRSASPRFGSAAPGNDGAIGTAQQTGGSVGNGVQVGLAPDTLPMDFNGDGEIQGAEYVAGFAAPFALGDIDGDGTLSEEELRSIALGRFGKRGQRH